MKIASLGIAFLLSISTFGASVLLAEDKQLLISNDIINSYQSVYRANAGQYEAELQTYSTNSDSARLTNDIIEDYFEKGYDIFSIADQDYLAPNDDEVNSGEMNTEIQPDTDCDGEDMIEIEIINEGSEMEHIIAKQFDSYVQYQLEDAVGIAFLQPYGVDDLAEILVTTDKRIVNNGEYFSIGVSFVETQNSNVALLRYTFDSSKFDYRGFTPSEGVTPLSINSENDVLEIIAMVQEYDTKDYGNALFSAKENINLGKMNNVISVEVFYVIMDSEGEKYIAYVQGNTSFITNDMNTVPGDTTGKGYVDLVDLSNVIDMFGIEESSPEWDTVYIYFDFNGNGRIDIQDIVFVAQSIA